MVELRGDFGIYHLYEYLFLCALFDDLLSAAALQRRHGAEKSGLSGDCRSYVFCVLYADAGRTSDDGVWRGGHCILRIVLFGGMCVGVQICAKDISDQELNQEE